ncbi:MAG TPA: thioester reductase domain-containing protein, partial [Anaerolineae bacterium]
EIAYRQGHRYANRLQQIKLDTLSPLRREAVQPNGDVLPYRLQFDRPGFLTSLSLNETTRRPPGPDEVEIQVQTAGLNFRDVMKVLGLYPGRPIDLTWLGDDVAGRVVAVGEGVTDLKPGEAAVGLAPYAFRSHVTVKRRAVFKKPSHLSFEEAATLPTVFLTAYYALVHLARLQPGERVLIHAGSGGVGQAAIQIAQDLGLEIFATAGTPEKRAFLRDQGIQHVFDSRSLDFADDVMRVTQGRGVDAVLNSLAGDFIPKNISVLAPFGRYLEIGKVDIYNNSKIGLEPLRNNISVFIIDLAQLMEHKPADFATILEVLRLKFEQKVYRALPHTVFPITQALEAFRYMAAGKHIGKNVLSFQADEIPVGRITEEGQLFRSGASYLISGGAGGFGLEVAKWMARQGARHLVLLTRSGPPDDAARADIEQLRSAGIDVVDARGDVTRPADVERVVQAIQMRSAPLAGVIHSAMVLNDDLIVDLDEIGFNRAFLPKLVGAWNLHQATLDIALDVFICFSSISSMVGTIKQANYSAGNAFLDTLAHYRRARGLSALTINWGALSGAGFVARNQDTARYLETTGLSPLPVVEALQTLRDILPLDGTQLGIARINWTELSKYLGGVAHSNVFSGLTQQETAVPADSSTMTHIIAAAPPNRLPLVEQFISQAVAAVLSIDGSQIDPETSLPQLGLDSLMSIELINSVNTRLNLNLAVSDVLGGSTMRDLAVILLDKILASPHVSGSSGIDPPAERESGIWSSVFDQPDSHLDLRAEAQLDPAIVPVATALPAIVSPQAILLTGATGFLGAFLLADLLHQTEAEIYCLVRAETTEAAHQRLQANLARYGLWDGRQQARLKPIPGDLAQPRLGLSTEQFQMLAARIEAIYHNGAALNLIQPYQALKAANVLSVQEMLQLATRTRIKPVHYVSTIAIFFAANRSRQTVIRESDQPDPHELRGGYMQSKWVAEELVWQAQERGIPCSIYRPGLISGHSQTGITNTQDLTSRLVKGSYQLGLYPDRNRALNIVPVDYVSRAIVHLSRQPGIWGQVFHLTNPQPTPLKDLVHWAGSLGATLQEASYREWRTALIDQVEQGIENELLPLLPFFSSDSPQQIEQQVDCQNTLRYLAGSDIVCPPMTPSLIETYVAYLIDSGFLELSPANTSA